MKENHFSDAELRKIFYLNLKMTNRIGSKECSWLEFKETFNFGDIEDYAKIMASFANNKGGYLIFGIKDKPRELLCLLNNRFDEIDNVRITQSLNSIFAPQIEFETKIYYWKGKNFGLIYVYRHANKPIIAIKNSGQIREADVFYRYGAKSERIKYAELNQIITNKVDREKENWINLLKNIASVGINNVAILDTLQGEIKGLGKTVIIDEKLLPQLKFIKEGEFSEKRGASTLKLIGELKTAPIMALKNKRVVVSEDIYTFRPVKLSSIVQQAIGKKFRASSEHTKAWKLHKPRPSAKQIGFRSEFSEFKEAENEYRYSQAWINLLIKTYKNEDEYRKLRKLKISDIKD